MQRSSLRIVAASLALAGLAACVRSLDGERALRSSSPADASHGVVHMNTPASSAPARPPLDLRRPQHTETATFALG
ncbi:MAG: hypothetical protein AAF682_29715 [Planctomycetota bacterium]